jgi:hypothetical protein
MRGEEYTTRIKNTPQFDGGDSKEIRTEALSECGEDVEACSDYVGDEY